MDWIESMPMRDWQYLFVWLQITRTKEDLAQIHLQFSKAHNLDFEDSVLNIVKQMSFCEICMDSKSHSPTC